LAADNCAFADADDYHPPENMSKMAAGAPLTDEDRAPWLARLRALIVQHLERSAPLVLACSALKAKYRRQLAGGCDGGGAAAAAATSSADAAVAFVLLDPPRAVLETRLAARASSHFMPPSLLASQLDALEVDGSVDGDDDIGWLLVVGSGNNDGGCDGAGGCHGVQRRLCEADDWPPDRIAAEIVRAWRG
jgi:gluconokinase